MIAKPQQAEEDDPRHPRHSYALFGHEVALNRAAKVLRNGRPPQGWLISGPPGIGKATLAYRIARYLLTYGPTAEGPENLYVAPDSEAGHQVEARAHPGLLVLTRGTDDRGKLRTMLTVDVMRGITGFFGMTATGGGWRVVIVDSADDMNDNAANALLKLLEEPPKRAILLLIAHAPGRLLPTIRSRCQRLDLRPLDAGLMSEALSQLAPDVSESDRSLLIDLAEGSLGLALKLCEGEGIELAREVENLVAARTKPDFASLFSLAERVTKVQNGLTEFGGFLTHAITRRIRERAFSGEPGNERWLEAVERLETLFGRAKGLNLEPRQTVLNAASLVEKGRRFGGQL